MTLDVPLIAGMIASGIKAASIHLDEVLEVTMHENAGIVYLATRDGRLFRVRVELLPPFTPDEAPNGP